MAPNVSHPLSAAPDAQASADARRGCVGTGRLAGGMTSWAFAAGILLLCWLLLWNKLRADWSANEQYEYGWFVPPLSLALLAMRWPDRPLLRPGGRGSGAGLALLVGSALLLLLPLRLIEEPNPDWRLLYWAHAGLLIGLTLAFFAWAGGKLWLRHFAFPALFLLLAVPWPSGPEQAVVQSLMRGVASISAEGMNVLGIPARPMGNVIRIRDQFVGVSEACSGIRSLQSTLMAGLLLGEISRLSPRRRVVLLGAGLALAMVANVFRSSLLVWIAARRGAGALEQVHDLAGFSVLIIVFGGLLWLNFRLGRSNRPKPAPLLADEAAAPAAFPARRVATGFLAAAGVWLVAVEAATAAWYGLTAPPVNAAARWTVAPPTDAPEFKTVKVEPMTTQILRYDQALSARWTRPGNPQDAACSLYFFRWEPGHASTTLAEMHQPHICLTASGMTQVADWGVQPVETTGGIRLPVRRYEFTLHGRMIYVFFVAWQDRIGAQELADAAGSRWDRLRAVAEHRANLGRQTLELIAVGPETPEQANAWFDREIAAIIRPLGPGDRGDAR